MVQRTTIEVWVTVDSGGQWAVDNDRDAALDAHIENNGIDGSLVIHKLTLSVPLPQDQVATITLPDDAAGEPVVLAE